jgi:hypothetical protein
MTVHVDVRAEGDGRVIVAVRDSAGFRSERIGKWLDGHHLLVAADAASAVADPGGLTRAVEQGTATTSQLREYGGLLFEAAFGGGIWERLVKAHVAGEAAAARAPYLELAIRCEGTGLEARAIQALRWEALHDGTSHVAAMGTDVVPGMNVPVGIVRIVPRDPLSAVVPVAGVPDSTGFRRIERIPRILFAVGSRLTDRNVRAGAEFMGIIRHLERHGGSIQARVLDHATRSELAGAVGEFRPDVLHVVGHGQRSPDGQVRLQFRADSPGHALAAPGADWLTAGDLLGALGDAGHLPTLVILSACQTASGSGPGGHVSGLPFAARVVAGGVPVVVAMAGDISDTACRVFTRALTTAIGQGIPLGKAAVRGRRAAFYGAGPLKAGSVDWVLPALFLAEDFLAEDPPGAACLVDTAALDAARRRVQLLSMAAEPVFCGRASFVSDMDRLLEGGDPLNVLAAYTPDPDQSFGGMRLLRELGARAVRAGVLPVLLGPYDKDPPTDRSALAQAIADRIEEMRDKLGLPERSCAAVSAVESDASRLRLAKAIRADLDALVSDLPLDDPVRLRPDGQPRVVLLCHKVDRWLDALDDLLGGLLDSTGVNGGALPVPVVLTGADIDPFTDARLHKWNGLSWVRFEPLDRFSAEDDEDILSYLWWLLNPPPRGQAYAVTRNALPGWPKALRRFLRAAPLYPAEELFAVAETLSDYFTSASDDDLLAAYAKVLP